jgi:DNA-binding transcriptional regulator GbsR (MarR family)
MALTEEQNPLRKNRQETTPSLRLSDLEIEAIDLFIRVAHLLNVPKSVAEIYGLLFVSATPVSFRYVQSKLDISVGSASQGLKLLRNLGAVKTVYVAGERCDYYLPETMLSKLTSGLLNTRFEPANLRGEERLERLSSLLDQTPVGDRQLLKQRIELLRQWRRKLRSILPILLLSLEA